jgi:hypothetical protein
MYKFLDIARGYYDTYAYVVVLNIQFWRPPSRRGVRPVGPAPLSIARVPISRMKRAAYLPACTCIKQCKAISAPTWVTDGKLSRLPRYAPGNGQYFSQATRIIYACAYYQPFTFVL